jgi:hypothetical protein
MAERDAAFAQVVRGYFDGDPVADGDPDEMFTHFTGDMGENGVSIGQLHVIHRGWQNLFHNAFKFNNIIFGHLFSSPFRLSRADATRESRQSKEAFEKSCRENLSVSGMKGIFPRSNSRNFQKGNEYGSIEKINGF